MMNNEHNIFLKTGAGFTLVETALALLIIGMALLGLLGLGKSGLQIAREADNDTRCEVMAESIFETLNVYNLRFAEYARTNQIGQSWSSLWHHAVNTPDYIPFPPVANMNMSPNLYLKINAGIQAAYDPASLSLNDWNPRYRLIVEFKDTSPIAGSFNTCLVTLFIYPDGDTYSSEFRLFSTLLTHQGGV